MTKAINIFDLSNGYSSLENALANFKAKLTLISYSGDILFLPEESKEIANAMISIGKSNQLSYFEIDSDYGHDAFLVELYKFEFIIKGILK